VVRPPARRVQARPEISRRERGGGRDQQMP
jgi:hypothetical protein